MRITVQQHTVRLAMCCRSCHHDWIILLDLDSLELPEYGSDQFGWVLTQLKVQARVARQCEAVDAVKVLDCGKVRVSHRLLVAFER